MEFKDNIYKVGKSGIEIIRETDGDTQYRVSLDKCEAGEEDYFFLYHPEYYTSLEDALKEVDTFMMNRATYYYEMVDYYTQMRDAYTQSL